jgi:two-component system, LytTR family, response regulator LytT
MTSVLIIEDEILTANRLEKLIFSLEPKYNICAKMSSIKSTLHWLQNNVSPDLIFMDIHLADGNSFELFKMIKITSSVVFTTAYDQYAIEAFRVEGLDYLLKPVEIGELRDSIDRFKKKAALQLTAAVDINEILEKLQPPKLLKSRFLVSFRDNLQSVDVYEIAYFVSEFKTSYIVTHAGEKYAIDLTLEEIENQVSSDFFFRASRQLIISNKSIGNITLSFNGKLKIFLKPSYAGEVLISREKSVLLKEWLNR